MPSPLTELTATYTREVIRWGNVAIIEGEVPIEKPSANGNGHSPALPYPNLPPDLLDDICYGNPTATIKLECEPGELTPWLSYRFYGRWTTHPKHGKQFLSQTHVRCQPHGMTGVIKYLKQAGVSQGAAAALWQKFNADAVRICREHPEVAVAALPSKYRYSGEKACTVSRWLEMDRHTEAANIDLIDLLGGHGFPKQTPQKCIKEWGNKAAELIRRNPYLLQRFRGCGFLRCDKLYLHLGGDPARLKRQAYCAWNALARDTEGHTWHPVSHVHRGLLGSVSGVDIKAIPAVKLAKRGGLIDARRDAAGNIWLADGRRAKNERTVAERVTALLAEPARWGIINFLSVSEHQKQELAKAIAAPIGVFGGGPGTGKTFTGARLIAVVQAAFGAETVAVAAPTGKAAVRITEVMQGYGVAIRARTIHSLLGVAQRSEGEGWGFTHDEHNPLAERFIFIDESSMIDTDLMASLLRACAPGTHLLLIGDTAQLPPVGHGAPLRDLIAAGVPFGELTEIRRNSGTIVTACHQIRAGKPFAVDRKLDPAAGKNLALIQTASGKQSAGAIVDLLRKIKASGKADPIWDCQVVVAVNKKSDLSRKDLNKVLQAELNPAGRRCGTNPFKSGDKVVNTKNGWFPVVDGIQCPAGCNQETSPEGKVFVANGELGRVLSVDDRLTTVTLDAPKRMIKIPRGAGGEEGNGNGDDSDEEQKTSTGCSWDLGYALSVHKSQGSEWPIVIVALDEYPGARMVCSREWLYTSISRAKRVCFLVGKIATAHGMIARVALGRRKTFLKELIGEKQQAQRELTR